MSETKEIPIILCQDSDIQEIRQAICDDNAYDNDMDVLIDICNTFVEDHDTKKQILFADVDIAANSIIKYRMIYKSVSVIVEVKWEKDQVREVSIKKEKLETI